MNDKELLKSTIGKTVENFNYDTAYDDSDLHIKFTDGTDLFISTSYNQADMYFDYIENNNEIEKEDDKSMSKGLNIIEASALRNTEFKVIFIDESPIIVRTDSEGNIREDDSSYSITTTELINAKFIPIQKSITFMEAITQNHYNDKTIRCEVDDKVYTYKPVQTKTTEIRAIETRGGISTEEILNGKWYIEEN